MPQMIELQIKHVNYRHVVLIWKRDYIAEPDIAHFFNGKPGWDPGAVVV